MIDASAIVSAGAQLAADVEVGPFTVIGADVVIGPRCWIGPHAVVTGHTTIGADSKIFPFASIGGAPQDKKYGGGPTRLVIGERNVFREFCTINRGATPDHGLTRIGDDNLFMAYTHVAHDCTIGNNVVMVNYAGLAGHVELGDWVILSGYTGVHQFCKIGAHAFTAALSGVTRDVPPYIMAIGQPAVPHSINSEGLKRRGFSPGQIRNLRHAYRILYRSDLPLATAVEQLNALAPTQAELRPLLEFIAGFGTQSDSLMSSLRVAIVAGEASGDALGAALIQALRERVPDCQVAGVAGPKMRAAGCEPLADAHELSVMGLFEVLPHLPRLLRLRARLVREFTALKPDVFVGVDYQQFNLGLGLALKARGYATVQYVSPQVWAWRRGRVRTIGRAFDLVLCLLPFEPAFYREHAVGAQFVGHPLADQIPLQPDRAAARAALELSSQAPVLALLPGSRVGEVKRLSAPFLRTAALLAARRPGLQVIVPTAGPAARREFARALGELQPPLTVRILDGQARSALTAADAALVASGTATLEALLCRCPMVVAYRFAAGTALLLRALRMFRLPYFSLPNLLAGEPLAPEFLQEAVQPGPMAHALAQLLDDAPRREYLQQRFQRIHESLRQDGAALAAAAVLQLLRERTRGGLGH